MRPFLPQLAPLEPPQSPSRGPPVDAYVQSLAEATGAAHKLGCKLPVQLAALQHVAEDNVYPEYVG